MKHTRFKKLFLTMTLCVMSFASFSTAQTIIRVDGQNGLVTPNPTNPGGTWNNAFKYLADAIDYAEDLTGSEEIWVRGGSTVPPYYPDDGGTPPTDTREATFSLHNNIAIYCGFAGGETLRNERDPAVNKVILSGDIDHNGINDSDNSFHVVTADSVNNTAIVDGATITMGNADSTFDKGAGLLIKSTTSASRPVILRCRFTNNIAAEGAAAHIITYQNASPDFRNCTFDHNEATTSGVVKIVIDGSQGPNVYFQNCLWHDNESGGRGGAIHCDEFAMLHLLNCTITRNTSTNGAAVAHDADTEGGPTRPFIVKVLNTIIWDNRSDDGEMNYSTDLAAQLAGDADVEHSCVMNLFETGSVYAANAVASIDDDPSFENPSIDDFRLTCASPAINIASNSHVQSDQFDLNQNNSTSDNNPDLDDETRIVAVADMGSYERPVACCVGDTNIDGVVNVSDLLAVISNWGACSGCAADVTPAPCGDGQVNVSDLLAVISNWGECDEHCPGDGGLAGGIPQSYYDCQNMCSGLSGTEWSDCMQKCFHILCEQGQTEFCDP